MIVAFAGFCEAHTELKRTWIGVVAGTPVTGTETTVVPYADSGEVPNDSAPSPTCVEPIATFTEPDTGWPLTCELALIAYAPAVRMDAGATTTLATPSAPVSAVVAGEKTTPPEAPNVTSALATGWPA